MRTLHRLAVAFAETSEGVADKAAHPHAEGNATCQQDIGTDPFIERLVGVAFNMIREYGRTNTEILIKMLDTIKSVAAHTHLDSQREVLLRHANLIEHDSHIGLPSEYDQQRVHASYEETLRAIGFTH